MNKRKYKDIELKILKELEKDHYIYFEQSEPEDLDTCLGNNVNLYDLIKITIQKSYFKGWEDGREEQFKSDIKLIPLEECENIILNSYIGNDFSQEDIEKFKDFVIKQMKRANIENSKCEGLQSD